MPNARTFALIRHGRTDYNREGRVNGDPQVHVALDAVGREQMRALCDDAAVRTADLAVRTRFPRTAESLAIVLGGRAVPVRVYPDLDDVRLGDFEGRPVGEYRAWRAEHPPETPPPGEGESRVDALYRYARGFERMLAEDADHVLAVIHDVPIRFLLNAVRGADPLDGPVHGVANGEVNVLSDPQIRRGLAVMRDRLGL